MIRRRTKTGEKTGVNLTPVLGVAFIMLLFFVVAAPFMRERGFYLVGWDAVCDCGCESGQIVFTVDNDNKIFVEHSGKQRQVKIRNIRAIVSRKLAEKPGCSVVVMAHRHSDMGTVIRVMDQAKQARNIPPHVTIAMMDS